MLHGCTSASRPVLSGFGAACAFLALLIPSPGCSSDKSPEPCGPREPAFGIQVTVGGADLPPDTRIRVAYGGTQSESFQLSKHKQNADVCCQVSANVITDELPRVSCASGVDVRDAGPARAIQCTLWTNGPATVDINAFGYLPIIGQELNTRLQEDEKCGVDTRDVRLILGRPEGGI